MKRLTTSQIRRCVATKVVNENIYGHGYVKTSLYYVKLMLNMKWVTIE
jgi:hypothetical protein